MNTTVSLEFLSENYSTSVLPLTIIFLILCLTGILGNLFVIIIYAVKIKDPDGQRYFIRYLAVIDLGGCLVQGVDLAILNNMMYTYPDGPLCNLMTFLVIFIHCLSSMIIMAITLQRYLMICRPMGCQLDLRRKRILLLLIASLSIIWPIPVFWNNSHWKKSCTFSEDDFDFFVIYQYCVGVFSLISIAITVVLYAMILYTLKPYKIRKTEGRSNGTASISRIICCLSCCKRKSFTIKSLNDKECRDGRCNVKNASLIPIPYVETKSSFSNQNEGNHKVILNNRKIPEAITSDAEIHVVYERGKFVSKTDKNKIDSTVGTSDRKSEKITETLTSSGKYSIISKQCRKSEKIITKMFLSILTVQILTWCVYVGSTFIPRKTPPLVCMGEKIEENFISVLRRAMFFGYLLNPIIYLYFDGQFRRKIKVLFCVLATSEIIITDSTASRT